MDKKDWTPEELELKEALNKLYETDISTPSKPLDLSFMNETAEIKSRKRRRRLAYIAAAVLLVFASSFATAVFISNDYASAVQDKIQRKVFEKKYGVVVATDEEFAEEGETVWEITDFDTAVKAKELVPELPIPGYVPEGYEFEKLVLQLYGKDKFNANYIFGNNKHKIYIYCYSSTEDTPNFSVHNILDTAMLSDRIIYLLEDPITCTKSYIVLFSSASLAISYTDTLLSHTDFLKMCTEL